MLKKHGLVDELDFMHLEGEKHYCEARTIRDHMHLACLKCGRIQEFERSLFEKLKGQISASGKFHIELVRVEAGGYCDRYQEKSGRTGILLVCVGCNLLRKVGIVSVVSYVSLVSFV